MKFVDDWKKSYKWFSVAIPTIGAAILSVWMALPDDMRAAIPHRYIEAITFFVLVSGVVGRLIKQAKP